MRDFIIWRAFFGTTPKWYVKKEQKNFTVMIIFLNVETVRYDSVGMLRRKFW